MNSMLVDELETRHARSLGDYRLALSQNVAIVSERPT